jgi:hypothetical protein
MMTPEGKQLRLRSRLRGRLLSEDPSDLGHFAIGFVMAFPLREWASRRPAPGLR